jgi:hypothetical protein
MELAHFPRKISCCYTNQTSNFQIVRVCNVPHFFFERSVLPKVTIFFETFEYAKLEIHTGTMMSAIFTDSIPCKDLIYCEYISVAESHYFKKLA